MAILANPDVQGLYATHLTAATGPAVEVLQGDIKLVTFDAGPQRV